MVNYYMINTLANLVFILDKPYKNNNFHILIITIYYEKSSNLKLRLLLLYILKVLNN